MLNLKSNRGSVLLASLIISLLLMAVIVQFSSWVDQTTRSNVRHVAGQKARVNADSGLQAALQFLRSPDAAILQPGLMHSRTAVEGGTTYYLELTRQVADTSLVDVHSYGYYNLGQAGAVSPEGTASQKAVVQAQIQLRNIGDYFAASPDSLEIGYGSNISSGLIYAKDLTFAAGGTLPKTMVKAASYFNSINPVNYASYVDFTDPNQPERVASEPLLPTLTVALRNKYQNMAGADVIPIGSPPLAGLVGTPAQNAYKVYFAPGDVTLGSNVSSCTFTGSALIYSQGDIYIANSVNRVLDSTAWPALLAEGNIYIAPSAPHQLEINATMVTNGEIKALGARKADGAGVPDGRLRITGGMVSARGITFGLIYTVQRLYTFQAPDPSLPMPFSTQVIFYKVISGKYK